MIGYGNSMFLATHGILARTASGGGVDPDAQAFITAASITDPTQQSAINQLVVDLKGYNIWTKMKALYPMVGGTAAQHKWNLKDPRDLDAAFRLVFNGGWTHSSTGALPNGTNGYADTFFVPSTHLGVNSNSVGYYSGTNLSETSSDPVNMGSLDSVGQAIALLKSNTTLATRLNASLITYSTATMRGFFSASRQSSTLTDIYLNGSQVSTGNSGGVLPTNKCFIGTIAIGSGAYALGYVKNDFRFVYLSDGLDDTETANFYTAVQAFQTTLGRSIGTQTVSDADAQAFVTNAGIVDQVEANAINNLVIGLKADGLWTKMKAVYPMVGGSSSTMKYNLKNPLDTDAAFRLVFNGGWTFSSNGATPNGTNAYANTYLVPNSQQSVTSGHFSLYSRTSGASSTVYGGNGIRDNSTALGAGLTLRRGVDSSRIAVMWNEAASGFINAGTETDARGFYLGSRTANNSLKFYKNNSTIGTNTNTQSITSLSLNSYYLAVLNEAGGPLVGTYDNKQLAFASIGDGLSDAEATNFYNRVQTFNTALARQV